MYQNENLRSSSITNDQQKSLLSGKTSQLQKQQSMKILIYIGYVSKDAIFMQFYAILPDLL